MVSYEIIEKQNNKIVFRYQPEGQGRYGIIAFDIDSLDRIPIFWSPDDPCHTYGIALWDGIENNLEDGIEIKDSGTIMWY